MEQNMLKYIKSLFEQKSNYSQMLINTQEKYLDLIVNKFGKYYDVANKKDIINITTVRKYNRKSIAGEYKPNKKKNYIYVKYVDEFDLAVVHEYIHYIAAIDSYTGVRIDEISRGLNESITEFLCEIIVYDKAKKIRYGRGVECISRFSNIFGFENVVENYFNHNIDFFINPFIETKQYESKEEFLQDFSDVTEVYDNDFGDYNGDYEKIDKLRKLLSFFEDNMHN